jgi:hypothetical protein
VQSGKSELIGKFDTSVNGLLRVARTTGGSVAPEAGRGFTLVHRELLAKKGKKYTGSGTIYVTHAHVEHNFAFADYISGGCQVSLIVAIDVSWRGRVGVCLARCGFLPCRRCVCAVHGLQRCAVDAGVAALHQLRAHERVPDGHSNCRRDPAGAFVSCATVLWMP